MVEFTEQKKAQVNDMKNNSARSALLILLAGALWGTMGIFVRRFNSFGFDAMQVASPAPYGRERSFSSLCSRCAAARALR